MDEYPLISVVVPCYQVEQYLPTCIESILRQTYRRLEVLLVDDGSPDQSGQICDAYAEKDERIRVIHKANGGLSDARNIGIELAKGEWITFIDSDDFVADHYVETLFTLARDMGCECSVCRFRIFRVGESIEENQALPRREKFGPLKAVEQMFYQEKFDNNAHSKLYHRRLFETGIRYPKGLVFEDLATTYKLLLESKGVAYTDERLYYYLLREDGIEGSYSPKKVNDAMAIMKSMDREIEMIPEIRKAYRCRKFSFMMHLLMAIPSTDPHYDQLKKSVVKTRKQVLFDGHARKKARVAALLSFLGMKTVKWVFSFTNQRR